MMILWCAIPVLVQLQMSLCMKVVDLTHDHGPATIFWPGNPEYNFTILAREQKPNFWYESNYLSTAEHGGTHLDSPAHFYNGGWRTQQIPIDRLVGPGVIVNVKSKASVEPDYRVTIKDLEDWESSYGRIPHGAVVIMNSGWSNRYPDKNSVFNTTTPNDPSTFHFPGWHEDAAYWLTTKRSVHVVGVDTPSTDYGQSKTFPTHVILGRNNILGVENVAYLDKIPENGTTVFVAVMKVKDGSGGPARVFATIDEKTTTVCSAGSNSFENITFNVIIFSFVALVISN